MFMKKILTLIVVATTLNINSQKTFCDGWEEGLKKGLDSCLQVGGTDLCPLPEIGADTYSDGYGMGYAKAREKCNSSKTNNNSNSNSKSGYTPPQPSTGAYANPKPIVEDYTSFSKGFEDGFKSVTAGLASQAAANEAEFKKIKLKTLDKNNNLNRYKYIVMEEDARHSKIFHKEYSKKYKGKIPVFINENSSEVKQNGGLDNFVNLNPEAVLFSFVQSTMGYDTTYVNLQLYDANGTQIFSGTGYRVMGFHKGAIKPILENLVKNGGVDYKYDETLGLLPSPKIEAEKAKLIKQELNEKDKAIEELKKLKDLLDNDLINKEEYEKKADELKKIILN